MAVDELNERLILKFELAALQSSAQPRLHFEASIRRACQRRGIEPNRPPAALFGKIEGGIGVLGERGTSVAVLWEQADADTKPDENLSFARQATFP
jgi:hypothetical protein